MVFVAASINFPPKMIYFSLVNTETPEDPRNEKHADRKMIETHLLNYSATSVSNSNMKNHMIGESVDVYGLFVNNHENL